MGMFARTCSTVVLVLAIGLSAGSASAQTVRGQLLDAESGFPVPLGLVMMFTEAGDSVTATVADEVGRFEVTSEEAGDFLLLADALGYEETPAGVFELGPGGEMTVEYRLAPRPLPIDEIIVSLDRPTRMHHLVRNGFIRRYQRGLGVFVTPHQIEEAVVASTEELLRAKPGIRVGYARVSAPPSANAFVIPGPDMGEIVQIQTTGGWCIPSVYVDGVRVNYSPDNGFTLSNYVPLGDIEAVEVYRSPAEIPVEYSSMSTGCGVLGLWSKTGLAPGQRPQGTGGTVDGAVRSGQYIEGDEIMLLPDVGEAGVPPRMGETVRMDIGLDGMVELGLGSPWMGTYVTTDELNVIVTDPLTARAMGVPKEHVTRIQVERPREPSYAWKRASRWSIGAALGTWTSLTFLCNWSDCNRGALNSWLPTGIVGALVFFGVKNQGAGSHWVETVLPVVAPGSEGGTGLHWSVPGGR